MILQFAEALQTPKVGDKSGYGERYALEMRLPLIRLVDGSGGGGSVKTLEMAGHSYVPALKGSKLRCS